MASKSLTFDIYGRDKSASKTIDKIGKKVDGTGDKFRKFGRVATAGIAVAAAALVKFGGDSVKAYAEAEESQNRLEYAWKQFPKAASVPLEAIRDLNTELMKKTRFDDDAIAVGQAQLAQFKLTGEQIRDLTPLMLDYAAKTGKDLPTASQDLGKALLGQGRALKDVGIDFEDTGTLAGNFSQLVGALRGQVQGFAEQDATTAAGKLENLQNRFGEVQEEVGEALMPALEDLMDFLEEDGLPVLKDTAKVLADDVIPAARDAGKAFTWVQDTFGGIEDGINLLKVGAESLRRIFSGEFFDSSGLEDANDWVIENGGPFGEMKKAWNDFFGIDYEDDAQAQVEGIRRGMGGGFSRLGMDNQAFRDDFKARWGTMWDETDVRTRGGVGAVVQSTGIGLMNTLARAIGFSSQFGGQWSSTWGNANRLTQGGWSNIEGSTRAGVGKVGGQVARVKGVVQSPFAGAAHWLVSAGENVVRGLVDGIAGMVGSAARQAADLAGAVVKSAKDMLGIRSPSKVFEQIGMYVGEGYQQGLRSQARFAEAAVNDLVATPVTLNATHSAAMNTVVYVENPWTGEYMEGRLSQTARRAVGDYDKQNARAMTRGARP